MKRWILLSVVAAVLCFFCGCSSSDYRKAEDLLENGQYEEAAQAFDGLGGYKDSAGRATEARNEKELQAALDLLEQGDYRAAYEALLSLRGYAAADQLLETEENLQLLARVQPFLKIGKVLHFGEYEQDADGENGKEPIEWIILDLEDNRALLLSRYVLDTRSYHNEDTRITWENCSMREWLNSTFYTECFQEAERGAILLTEVDNSRLQNDPYYTKVSGGSNTEDRIFLLSPHEACTYLPSDYFRAAEATDYALQRKVVVGNEGRRTEWYLRIPGLKVNRVCSICDTGMPADVVVKRNGNYHIGIRPAMWVDLSDPVFQPELLTGEDFLAEYDKWLAAYENPEDDRLRSVVRFGTYEQDGNKANGQEPIEWIVAEIQGDRCLLISRYILDWQQYHSGRKHVTWENCSLRKWLNKSFLEKAFDGTEREAILTTTVDNSLAQMGNLAGGGEDTEDKLFVLSYLEASRYFPTDESRVCEETRYARTLHKSGRDPGWWNRTPYCWSSWWYVLDACNGPRGFMDPTGYGGVLPAMWVRLDSLSFDGNRDS